MRDDDDVQLYVDSPAALLDLNDAEKENDDDEEEIDVTPKAVAEPVSKPVEQKSEVLASYW